MIKVFIGYDGREAAAFNVLAYSIHRRASAPVTIATLMLSQLQGIFHRERHPLQSTDFSFSRFLTPYLSDYAGWSIFMDKHDYQGTCVFDSEGCHIRFMKT